VADSSPAHGGRLVQGKAEDSLIPHLAVSRKTEALFSMLKRRPCSLKDICAGLDITPNEALKYISDLQHRRLIHSEQKDGSVFFKTSS